MPQIIAPILKSIEIFDILISISSYEIFNITLSQLLYLYFLVLQDIRAGLYTVLPPARARASSELASLVSQLAG